VPLKLHASDRSNSQLRIRRFRASETYVIIKDTLTLLAMIFSLSEIYPPRSICIAICHTTTGSSGKTFPGVSDVLQQALPVEYYLGVGDWFNLAIKND
jgi:hypothetical protein